MRRKPELKRLARSWYGSSGRDGSPFRTEMQRQGRAGTWRVASESGPASPAVAERLDITAGDPVMCSRYTFLADEQPVMLSTSWEPLDLTHGTPVMFPEGPHAGAGVVARMRAIGQHVESVQEVVSARPVLQSEAELLGGALGSVVMVIQRTYRTAERAVETADIVVPTDRYEVEYVLPVE
ncbi:UTRA domain-containing protein [Actinomadura verrucosospora]